MFNVIIKFMFICINVVDFIVYFKFFSVFFFDVDVTFFNVRFSSDYVCVVFNFDFFFV